MAGPNRVVDKIDKTAEIGKPTKEPMQRSRREDYRDTHMDVHVDYMITILTFGYSGRISGFQSDSHSNCSSAK